MSQPLTDAQVHPGDILLCKQYGAIPLWSVNGKHVYIRGMQALTTHNRGGGSSNSVHAALAVDHDGEGRVTVIEAVGTGLAQAHIEAEALVFRYVGPNAAGVIAEVVADACSLLRERIRATAAGEDFGKYDFKGGAVFQFRSAQFGAKAQAAVNSVAKAVDGDIDGNLQRMVCSGFVTMVYQAAAQRQNTPLPIVRDGRNMTPKALEAYLRQHTGLWEKVGRYNRPTGRAATRWAKRLTGRDH